MRLFSPILALNAGSLVLASSGNLTQFDELYQPRAGKEPLNDNLIIKTAADLAAPQLDPSRALRDLEALVFGALSKILPKERRAQVVLGFPGRSKTDPLYALRFLDYFQKLTGVTGYLRVFEKDDDALMQRYYREVLPVVELLNLQAADKQHVLEPYWGPETGDVKRITRSGLGHLALSLYSGCHYSLMREFFRNVLSMGGIAVWTEDFIGDRTVEEGGEMFEAALEHMSEHFEVLQNPIAASPFQTAFSGRYPNGKAVILRKIS